MINSLVGSVVSATSAAQWRAAFSPAAATPATAAAFTAAISQTFAATSGNYRNYGYKHGSGGTWRNIG